MLKPMMVAKPYGARALQTPVQTETRQGFRNMRLTSGAPGNEAPQQNTGKHGRKDQQIEGELKRPVRVSRGKGVKAEGYCPAIGDGEQGRR